MGVILRTDPAYIWKEDSTGLGTQVSLPCEFEIIYSLTFKNLTIVNVCPHL